MTGDFDDALAGSSARATRSSTSSAGCSRRSPTTRRSSSCWPAQPAAAERRLRPGYEKLEEMGERGLLATTAAMLAQALYDQGRYDEAGAQCDVSEAAAPHEDFVDPRHVAWGAGQAARPGRPARGGRGARPRRAGPDRADRPAHAPGRRPARPRRRPRARGPERTRPATPRAARSGSTSGKATSSRPSEPVVRLASGPGGESTEVDDAALAVRQGRDPR